MKRTLVFVAAALSLAANARLVHAQPTSTNSISLQAKLDGVSGPTANLTVKFYDALTGGTQVGATIALNTVPVQNGIVSVPVSPVDATIFNGQTRYMGISVNGGAELTPRTLVTSVPYAVSSKTMTSGFVEGALRVVDKFMAGPEYAPPNDYAFIGNRQRGVTTLNYDTIECGFYPLLSNGSPYAGYGVVEGPSRHSPVVWMYGNSGNAFEVRVVGFGGNANTGDPLFGVLSSGAVVTGNPNRNVDLYVNGRAYMGNTELFQTPGQSDLVLKVNGRTETRVLTITGADLAEPFTVAKSDTLPEPISGMVVSIDPANPGKLMVCYAAYDKKVAGAISGAGGLSVGVVMGKDNPDPLIKGEHPVAMSGRVYVWCDAASGAITPGDRLTTSATPGHAMRVMDESKAGGAVIGKAMTELKEGKGLVLVLVNLQ